MYIKNQSFLVVGISKSGYSCSKYILKKGGKCYIYEDKSDEKIEIAKNELIGNGAILVSKENVFESLNDIDIVILSPGVTINNEVALKAKKIGKKVTGELEFGFDSLMATNIAITGTNGKTTTVSLIEYILKSINVNCLAVGNIGTPITEKINEIQNDTILITEVSSFQLETTKKFCPHIACILNITPDHLERHYSFENYMFLKKKIFENQTKSEYTVLNYDDENVKSFSIETNANIVWFSKKEIVNGAYVEDNQIKFKGEIICNIDEMALKGQHNLENSLCAVCCLKLIGVKNEDIKNGFISFQGVKHRLEFVKEIEGVKYINDSKATNTASTISAIKSISEPVILILGGSEKGEKYNDLFTEIKNHDVKQVILMGASRFNMLDCASKFEYSNITITEKFEDAIYIAKMFSKSGDVILLSPACASFDQFSNYIERGEKFCWIVKSL